MHSRLLASAKVDLRISCRHQVLQALRSLLCKGSFCLQSAHILLYTLSHLSACTEDVTKLTLDEVGSCVLFQELLVIKERENRLEFY